MSRLIILLLYIKNSISRIIYPNNVNEVYMDGSPVSKDYVHMCLVVIFMFMVTICVFTVIFMLSGVESVSSIEVVVSMITSLGTVDVALQEMSPFLKVMMVLMMWAGRLEILVALAMLSPRVWIEHIRDVGHNFRRSAQR